MVSYAYYYYFLSYAWKSGICDSTGWYCIGNIGNEGTYGSMYWSPGTYYFLVKSPYSWSYSHVFYIICQPNAPTLASSAISSNQIDLLWNDVEGETGYKIFRAPSPGGAYTLIGTTAADITTYSDVGLNTADDYCYHVKSYNNDAESVYSNESCTTTLPLPPPAPSNLAATAYSNSEVNLLWNDVSNETGYKIYRALTPGGTYSQVDSTLANTTYYYDNGLTVQTQYCYRVKAYNLGGISYYSNEDCATTSSNGIEAYVNIYQYSVYPIPANDKITIESLTITKNETVSLYSIQGQLLIQQAKGQAKLIIDISQLVKGVYILKIENSESNTVKWFIKE